ncbi:MAG TPA: calcium-binding protein [Sphingomicrobium sp.]|nr:calcium-binding protein [Sphingomicrobium sp.]
MAKPPKGVTKSGTAGDDELIGGAGNDQLYGLAGSDRLEGLAGNDTLYGHEGDDYLIGGEGDDYLAGQEGNDTLEGGTGNDFLGAGPGNDLLTGGDGADRFFFAQPFEPVMNLHTITDFSRAEGDFIDLRSIDADGNAANDGRRGNTDFTVMGSSSGAAGEAWMQVLTNPESGQQIGVSIYLNTDSDPEADMRIDVLGVSSLNWGTDILG